MGGEHFVLCGIRRVLCVCLHMYRECVLCLISEKLDRACVIRAFYETGAVFLTRLFKKKKINNKNHNTRLFLNFFFLFSITKKPFLACFHTVFPNFLSILANVNALMKTQYMEIFVL